MIFSFNEVSVQANINTSDKDSPNKSHNKRKCSSTHTIVDTVEVVDPKKINSILPDFQEANQHHHINIMQKKITTAPNSETTSSYHILTMPSLTKPSDSAFETRCGKWAYQVTNLMDQVHKNMPDSSTYYKYIHPSPPSKIWLLLQRLICANKRPDDTIGNTTSCKQYNPDSCFNQQDVLEIEKKIIDLRKSLKGEIKPNVYSTFDNPFICADLIKKSIINKVGNCGEKARYFAVLYKTEFPDHEVNILTLTGKGDHTFVQVKGEKIGSVIIDPWTHRYFPENNSKLFLHNPNNAHYQMIYCNEAITQIHAAMPENLPEAFKPMQESLKSIDGLDNKVKHLKIKYPEFEVIDGYLSINKLNHTLSLMTDEVPSLILNNQYKSINTSVNDYSCPLLKNLSRLFNIFIAKKNVVKLTGNHRVVAIKKLDKPSWAGFVITKYGLHLFKPD